MPDIFIPAGSKKEPKNPTKYSWEEEHPVMLHGEEVLKDIRKELKNIPKTKETEKPDSKRERKKTIISSQAGLFSSFKIKPKGIRFHEQDEDEEILLVLRKHFITNVPWLFFGTILLIFPFLLFYIFAFTEILTRFSISIQMIIVLIYAYYLVVFCYIFVSYITWYYNTDLITNKKIVDIHFQDIIYHHISMTKLNLVENINYVQSGFFGSLFGYGDIYIETAGKSLTFHFMSVPNPENAVNLIESLMGGVTYAE